MRHHNSADDALRSTVGVAAKLTVRDDSMGKPVFRNWEPYAAVRERAPVRETDMAAVRAHPAPDLAQEAVP
jgi:hypothetical protein